MTSLRLRYSQEELLADHEFAELQMVLGKRLHGGMLANGSYQPPRALVRERALDAWEAALIERGGESFGASADLLGGFRLPTAAQQIVLICNGLGLGFWNSLTITGKIEARGRLLAEMQFPHLQPAIVEDISDMAIGHLNSGLLLAHGLDEGGSPDAGIGGHDEMWFAVRDLAFGAGAYPDVDPPENIARPEAGSRLVPEIAAEIEGLISLLTNLLIIEFRAEIGFADSQEILRSSEIFADRRSDADLAAEIVGRIRIDEAIHVRSLNIYLGEMRAVSFKTQDGATISGAEIIDRFWDGLVRWATVDQPALFAEEQRKMIHGRIDEHPEAARVLEEFAAAA